MSNKIGRPRKYKNDAEKTRVWREKNEGKKVRCEVIVSAATYKKLTNISKKKEMSLSGVFEMIVSKWKG